MKALEDGFEVARAVVGVGAVLVAWLLEAFCECRGVVATALAGYAALTGVVSMARGEEADDQLVVAPFCVG